MIRRDPINLFYKGGGKVIEATAAYHSLITIRTMIHYHGTPINPKFSAARILAGRHAFVSFADLCQFDLAVEICQSWALDNGAFSAWRSGKATNWTKFYDFAGNAAKIPNCDFAIIPDVIDGTETDNDALLAEWELGPFGVPVYHLHESLDRLARLVNDWPRIALGSSGQFATVGNAAWYKRMSEMMRVICDEQGRPKCKLHGLRMLNTTVFPKFPFSSADSTHVARQVGIDKAWKGTYTPATKEMRGLVLAERIEAHQASVIWDPAVIGISGQFEFAI